LDPPFAFVSQVLPDYKTRCEQQAVLGDEDPEVLADRAWFTSAVRRFLSAGARGGSEKKPTRFRHPVRKYHERVSADIRTMSSLVFRFCSCLMPHVISIGGLAAF